MKILELFENHNSCDCKIIMPYIIAEAGVNHEGNIHLAKRLIDETKDGGANAIKFQTYKAEKIASKESPVYWDTSKETTKSQFELFKKYDKFWKKEFKELKKHCDKTGIEFMSTPFDTDSALFLNDLMDVFKISSSDITNKPFIEYICKFGKPIILSTGASYVHEIEDAVGWIQKQGNKLALLHCILNYPTDDKDANLGMILSLKRKFPDKIIGYSDHTLPKDMKTLETAALLGAVILEKHITYDKSLPGNDHYHAMDKVDLKTLKRNLRKTLKLFGNFKKHPLRTEKAARQNARRSLVAKKHIPKGQKIKYSDLTYKRPASGISPKDIKEIVGKTAQSAIKEDEILKWHMFK